MRYPRIVSIPLFHCPNQRASRRQVIQWTEACISATHCRWNCLSPLLISHLAQYTDKYRYSSKDTHGVVCDKLYFLHARVVTIQASQDQFSDAMPSFVVYHAFEVVFVERWTGSRMKSLCKRNWDVSPIWLISGIDL
ncbi:hypothetical protein BO99DRAFT_60912 [Aspergillus violaceofuscus CBS 115571]|uniref:Uncharacterized protein n=1 Tax=Aspergillus violaceofuscus (strain CBS 115571) TaxID=1450538 RepID=A0A2V5HGQ9_ASPV1|nr:hypothetical protein BO99DRAFT_60912 [Aspergillus violaceofuscus CBS 115571]